MSVVRVGDGLAGDFDDVFDALGFPDEPKRDSTAPIVSVSIRPFGDEWAATWRRADGFAACAFAASASEARAILTAHPSGPPDGLWLPVDPG